MHRIDSEGHVDNLFVDEDANQAIAGTKMAADWLNAIQEELINILIAAEIDPNKASNDQLALAFQLLGGSKDWADILNKPSTFPPDAHNQAYSTITGTPELPLGVGQTWKSTSYTINTNHYNTSGRAIYVIIGGALATEGGDFYSINGKSIFNEAAVGFIVPPGDYFSFPYVHSQVELS